MTSDLINFAEQLGGQKVLLVGDLMLDRYVYGDAERMSPEAPVPILRLVDEQERVGGSGSVAANLVALGLEVYCCGLVGDDQRGTLILELLQQIGANCAGILRSKNRPTTTKTRFVGLAQHRHRQQLLRFDREDTRPIAAAEVEVLIKVVGKVLPKVDVVCIEDYNKGVVGADMVARIVALAKTAGKVVLVDPAAIDDFERYRGATLVTPNRNELSAALQRQFTDLQDMAQAASDLARRMQWQGIVVTLDRDGALLVGEGQVDHIPTRPRAVYDNTGAGDAVLAMLAAAIATGADFRQAVHLANVAGGLEVEKFGCVPITRDEVLADLRIEHRRRIGKLRTLEDLLGELTLRRDRGESVAFTNGCFDLLHRGHVEYLQEAADLADILVLGLNSDDSVRRQHKGSCRPLMPQADRAAILGALQAVDYVVIFDDDTPEKLIRTIKPSVLVKGEDWKDQRIAGQDFVEQNGGKVVFAKFREGYSTTSLLQRLQDQAK